MTACPRCGGRLQKKETKCFACGAPVIDEKTGRTLLLARLRMVITALMFLSGGLTIASLFTDVVPSFMKCSSATVILRLVKSSADEMAEVSD